MKANKALGQHFLKDRSLIEKICSDFSHRAQSIIEIGPGPGVLTSELSKLDLPFYAIEKDQRFVEILTPLVNLTLADALTIDIDQFASEKELQQLWLVSNLPYNVASPLLINFLRSEKIHYMTLMFQKEVGIKLIDKSMSSLKFLGQNYYECRLLRKVAPGAFHPPPKVDSIVISFEKRENPRIHIKDFGELEAFLKKLFSGKRKQLGTTLKRFYPPNQVSDLLNKCQIDTKIRAEALEMDSIYRLYEEIKSWQ